MKNEIVELVRRAPAMPGCYVMKSKQEGTLYVGKALNLQNRLQSYIKYDGDTRPSVRIFVPKIEEIEWIVTRSEKEALLLERTLIQNLKPKYNIDLRDDKSYVSLKLSSHKYPRMSVVRKRSETNLDPKATYFGPYDSAYSVRSTLLTVQKVFQLRDCNDYFFQTRKRPCLKYQIKRCSAPCMGYVSQQEYADQVNQAVMFIEGKTQNVIKTLERSMDQYSQSMEFEKAASVRDKIRAIEHTLDPQQLEDQNGFQDTDVVAVHGDGEATMVQHFILRDGKISGVRRRLVDEPITAGSELIRTYLLQTFLESGSKLPDEILINIEFEDLPLLQQLLREAKGKTIEIKLPKRGRLKHLLDMAEKNAIFSLSELKRKSEAKVELLKRAQQMFHLQNHPRRIEGYDISNTSGTEAVASMVVFTEGEPDKKQYRIFKMKFADGPNDFAMMNEVLTRRFDKEEKYLKPDLVLIDGGKGQLKQCTEVLKKLGIQGVDVLSLAKEKSWLTQSGKNSASERVFRPGQMNPIVPKPGSKELHLLMRVRDEAHRFGITHHKKLRQKRIIKSSLDEIPGIGKKRVRKLLTVFGSIESLKVATLDELIAKGKLPLSVAKVLHSALASLKSESLVTPKLD